MRLLESVSKDTFGGLSMRNEGTDVGALLQSAFSKANEEVCEVKGAVKSGTTATVLHVAGSKVCARVWRVWRWRPLSLSLTVLTHLFPLPHTHPGDVCQRG